MILGKRGQALGENRNLFPLDERGAGADALLGAAAGVERDAGDAVVEHLFHEVGTGDQTSWNVKSSGPLKASL